MSAAFATSWSDAPEQVISTRLYRLAELEPPAVSGSFRMADESDIPLLARWRVDFTAEAIPFTPPGPPADEVLRRSFALGYGMSVWEVDGMPVAWATAGPPTAGMSRIGPVYTPPEHRRHGYGAAVTAAVSRWAVAAGAEHVVLFADLFNPISNSIYQRIGSEPGLRLLLRELPVQRGDEGRAATLAAGLPGQAAGRWHHRVARGGLPGTREWVTPGRMSLLT